MSQGKEVLKKIKDKACPLRDKVFGASKTAHTFCIMLEGLHRAQHIIVLMTKIYHNDTIRLHSR